MKIDLEHRNGPEPAQPDRPTIGAIAAALRYYPYYVLLRGAAVDDARGDRLLEITEGLRRLGPGDHPEPRANGDTDEPASFTEVRVSPTEAARANDATFFSRTAAPLAPHTDSSYADAPHELVAFQCVRAADDGGATIMTPIDDIMKGTPRHIAHALRRADFPFGRELRPILSGPQFSETIRYYRAQIDQSARKLEITLSADCISLLNSFDAQLNRLAETAESHTFRMAPGDILLMNNAKVLHARTGFAQTSERLIYRVRERAPGLIVAAAAAASAEAARDFTQELRNARRAWRNGEGADAERALRAVLTAHPDAVDAEELLSEILIHYGRFDEAMTRLEALHARRPDAYEGGFAFAALLRDAGRDAEAERVDRTVLANNVVIAAERDRADHPTVLWARAFGASRYGLTRRQDGAFESSLRGGHFAITDLLSDRDADIAVLNVFEDNIDALGDEIGVRPRLLLNTIACPDSERRALLALARFCDARPQLPVINHPRAVLRTSRDETYARLGDLPGVLFPLTIRTRVDPVDRAQTAKELVALGLRFPFIWREVGSHTGRSARLVDNTDGLIDALEEAKPSLEYYAIAYVDCRRSDGLYPKSRVFFVDGAMYPVASIVHESWSVHSGDRYAVMADDPSAQAREQAFLASPAEALGGETVARLHQIARVIGLDFFGVDFTVLGDGRLLVFEANPAMRHNFDHAPAFAYTAPHLRAVGDAFAAMVQRRAARPM